MFLSILMWSLLAALAIMLLAPHSRLGKTIHETLVLGPARFLFDLTWAKAGRIVLLPPVFVLLVMAGPEMIAVLTMLGGDLAAVEIVLAVCAMSVSGSFANIWRQARSLVVRFMRLARHFGPKRSSGRAARQRRRRRPKRPGREDEPGWAFA